MPVFTIQINETQKYLIEKGLTLLEGFNPDGLEGQELEELTLLKEMFGNILDPNIVHGFHA